MKSDATKRSDALNAFQTAMRTVKDARMCLEDLPLNGGDEVELPEYADVCYTRLDDTMGSLLRWAKAEGFDEQEVERHG